MVSLSRRAYIIETLEEIIKYYYMIYFYKLLVLVDVSYIIVVDSIVEGVV